MRVIAALHVLGSFRRERTACKEAKAEEHLSTRTIARLETRHLRLKALARRAASTIMERLSQRDGGLQNLAMSQGSLTVSLIIPTLNEAENLPLVLPLLPDAPEMAEIVLVDGGSTDDTIAVAKARVPHIRVVLQDGRGKSDSTRCGVRAAWGDYVVILDADGCHNPQDVPRYIALVRAGHEDNLCGADEMATVGILRCAWIRQHRLEPFC